MVKIFNYLSLAVIVLFAASCDTEYDNYDAPSVVFQGQLKDVEGDDFQFDASKSLFAFYQTGYGKIDIGTGMNVSNNGAYRQLLFHGDYTLTLYNNRYPFDIVEFPKSVSGQGYDSIRYNITGNVEVNFTVRPYYKVTSLDAAYDKEKQRIVATFTVKRLVADAPSLKRAYLYLGTAVNVNSSNKCTRMTTLKPTGADEETFTAMIPIAYYRNKNYGMVNNTRSYAFYRIGLMVEGYNDYYLFSETKKIEGLTDLQ
jgi:hypothetical protein